MLEDGIPPWRILGTIVMVALCLGSILNPPGSLGSVVVPNGVKVAVKTYRLLSCFYQTIESILSFLNLF